MQNFEVELRALITEKKYQQLLKQFETVTKGEPDDAETYAFLTKDYNIKVKKLTSKGIAKITLKKGAEYKQQTEERELPIDPSDIEKAVAFITALDFKKYIPSHQKRTNYTINGISISVKYEPNWGYHIEAEIVVNKQQDIERAKRKLRDFFKELGVKPMTEEQTRALTNAALKKFHIELI